MNHNNLTHKDRMILFSIQQKAVTIIRGPYNSVELARLLQKMGQKVQMIVGCEQNVKKVGEKTGVDTSGYDGFRYGQGGGGGGGGGGQVVVVDGMMKDRCIMGDYVLSRLKRWCQEGKGKVVLMGWKGDIKRLETYMEGMSNTINNTSSRQPQIYYQLQTCSNYLTQALRVSILLAREGEDVFVFMPDKEQIEVMLALFQEVEEGEKEKGVEMVGYYGGMYERGRGSKSRIVVGMKGIRCINQVVDCMYERWKREGEGGEREKEREGQRRVSQESGERRAGEGICYRLCTREEYDRLDRYDETQMAGLEKVILKRLFNGEEPLCKDIIDQPSNNRLTQAFTLLYSYQLIVLEGGLTLLGQKVAGLIERVSFPMSIQLSVMIVYSCQKEYQCSKQVVMLGGMVNKRPYRLEGGAMGVLKAKKKRGVKEGDHLSLINVMAGYLITSNKGAYCSDNRIDSQQMQGATRQIDQINNGLEGIGLNPHYNSSDDQEPILRCILAGYFQQIAQLQPNGVYSIFSSSSPCTYNLHPQSILSTGPPRLVVFTEVLYSEGLKESFLHNVSGIDDKWVVETAGHYYLDRSKEMISHNRLKDIKVRSQMEEDQALMDSLKSQKANVHTDFQLGTYRSIHTLGYKSKDPPQLQQKQKQKQSSIQFDYQF